MLIINADDWGRSRDETAAALKCFQQGKVTSVTGMVFMADSARAATVAQHENVPVGLHLNFNEPFTADAPALVRRDHERVVRFLRRSRYHQLIYNPFLAPVFRSVVNAQLDEFRRLYGKEPSHFDGHQHMHLCMNMLALLPIPRGRKVRRSFSFARGEKSAMNRKYRSWIDRRLAARYCLTDHFFALSQQMKDERIDRVLQLAKLSTVELMTHPIVERESTYLMGAVFAQRLAAVRLGNYLDLQAGISKEAFSQPSAV